MTPRIAIERLRKVALITSAGLSVVLVEAPWSAPPTAGGVRPALIASTARVNAPAVSPAAGVPISPALIPSSSTIGLPTIMGGARVPVAPSRIESTVAIQAPAITAAITGTISPVVIASVAFVGTPLIEAAAPPTVLPAGIASWWDPASLASADGAIVTSWMDKVGGAVAANTADSTISNTYVANSGGLPAVRLSGEAVMVTLGSNAAATAVSGSDFTTMVVIRNIQNINGDQQNPGILAHNTGSPESCVFATPTQTGRYNRLVDCGDPGMRTLATVNSGTVGMRMLGVNGTAIKDRAPQSGDQIQIGGWRNRNETLFCGRADVLATIVWNRALTAAELKQAHRYWCEKIGQARPGNGTAPTISFIGDSLTEGYIDNGDVNYRTSYPGQLVAGLGLPWGTFDLLGYSGDSLSQVKQRVDLLGSSSAATGTKSIVCLFEFANTYDAYTGKIEARNTIDKLHAQDPNRDVIFGTSTDERQTNETARGEYNAYWDDVANRAGIQAYVRLHLDPNIGVSGAAPANGSGGNTYYVNDGTHLTPAGYALIDNGPYGFRTAVQARMAA